METEKNWDLEELCEEVSKKENLEKCEKCLYSQNGKCRKPKGSLRLLNKGYLTLETFDKILYSVDDFREGKSDHCIAYSYDYQWVDSGNPRIGAV